jgi:class 3 adenylate cyclase/Tfp pilus assembly protein PilF
MTKEERRILADLQQMRKSGDLEKLHEICELEIKKLNAQSNLNYAQGLHRENANYYRKTHQLDKFWNEIGKLDSIANLSGISSHKFDASYAKAQYYYSFDTSMAKADRIFDSLYTIVDVVKNDTTSKANLCIYLGYTKRQFGSWGQSTSYFLQASELYISKNDSSNYAIALYSAGGNYFEVGNLEQSKQTIKEVLDIRLKSKSQHEIELVYNLLGQIYDTEGKNDSAEYYFRKSIEIAQKKNNLGIVATAGVNLAELLTKRGNYNEAIGFIDRSIFLNKKSNNLYRLINNYYDKGEALYGLKKYREAYQYYDSAFALTTQTNRPDVKAKVELGMAKIKANQGDYQTATKLLFDYIESDNYLRKIRSKDDMYRLESDYKQKLQNALIEEEKIKANLAKTEVSRIRILTIGLVLMILATVFFAIYYYRNYQQKKRDNETIAKEKQRSDELLLNILPAEVAEELKQNGKSEPKYFEEISVLFTDFKDFTHLTEKLSAKELVMELNHLYTEFDKIVKECGLEKIKTIGDAYMAASGLPIPNDRHAYNAVKAALKIRDFTVEYNNERVKEGLSPFKIRIGIHSGSAVAGIVGSSKFAYDIWGDTVNTAARFESSGEVNKVNISETTKNLLNDAFLFDYRGEIPAKNKGMIKMYFVENYS